VTTREISARRTAETDRIAGWKPVLENRSEKIAEKYI
jgi:hypothetical protein